MERAERTRLTLWQRLGMRQLRRRAGREGEEPLRPEDWEVLWRMHEHGIGHVLNSLFLALPHSPRCGVCGAPFAGMGRLLAAPLGYRPSRKNPQICATCVELAPPGGMKMPTGVLFADVRGFTAHSEQRDPEEVMAMLRRFYCCAEDVLFPEAVIDKLIGDEVMALYLPFLKRDFDVEAAPQLMLTHAIALLHAVGYGDGSEPFAEVGIGMDFGEAFVGNIGQRSLFDFTAVGDVVNTAARLQAQAAGGEILLSERLGRMLPAPIGEPVELALKGKSSPQLACRVAVGASAALTGGD